METLKTKFFSDPDWAKVEELLMGFVNPLIEMSDIDLTQPAEHIKAEVIGRQLLHKRLCDFLEQTEIVGKPRDYKKTTFK